MAEEVKLTEGEQVKAPEVKVEESKDAPTIGDVMGTEAKEESKVEEPKTIGLDKFLELKKENKEFKKAIKSLESQIQEGGTKEEISESISDLSEEYPDVDPKFLQKLVKTIKAESERDLDDKVSSKLKPFEEKEKREKLQTIFKEGFTQAMETMPEYNKVVNEDTIFKLSLIPDNQKKTFAQLIEETYGNAIGGKRTMQTTTPGGGKEPEPLDVARAAKDTTYFLEVMANPKLKAEYNRQMLLKGF